MSGILAFEPDLLFSSRIEAVAQSLGIPLRLVTDIDDFAKLLVADPPSIVLVNLDLLRSRQDVFEAVCRTGAKVAIGYYSHVDTNVAKAAQVGFHVAVSRGVFSVRMREIISKAWNSLASRG